MRFWRRGSRTASGPRRSRWSGRSPSQPPATRRTRRLGRCRRESRSARRDAFQEGTLALFSVDSPTAPASVGFDSTKPGAMQLTVIPTGPSSWAIWRVKPICAAFDEVYAWMPVRLTLRPAPEEIIHDPAEALLLHRSRRGSGAVHGGREVRVDHRVPRFVGQLVDRGVRLSDDSAGVVDENVHRHRRRSEELLDSGRISQVDRCPCRPCGRSHRRR